MVGLATSCCVPPACFPRDSGFDVVGLGFLRFHVRARCQGMARGSAGQSLELVPGLAAYEVCATVDVVHSI